jgi:RNA polymerase sigma factor for flagellar operon FliA
VEADDLRTTLIETVRHLPDRERHVVALYYFESMTLAQIGEVLGVTESRVSQVHAKAVLSLRNRIALATRKA